MLAALSLLLYFQAPLQKLDQLAQTRDAEQLTALASPELLKQVKYPFAFTRQGGAYGVGRYGWHAFALPDFEGDELIVFSTKLTSEDIGEMVFVWRGGRFVKLLSEKDDLGIKLVHHAFDVHFKPAEKKAFFVDAVDFQKEAGAGSQFLVRMGPQYQVTAVNDAEGKAVPFKQAGGVVALPTASTADFRYRFSYSAIVDLPRYAGSINAREVMLTNDYWYPMIARQPSDFTIQATVPSSWEVVTQGEEVSSKIEGDSKTVAYKMDLPVVFFSFSAGPFKKAEEIVDGVKVASWSSELNEEQLHLQNLLQAPVIKFYSEHFGKFPFSRWGAMETPLYGGGALEAYSYATYGSGWLPAEDSHEPSHTWWGGIIPNGYLNSFWNESFADYSTGLYAREAPIGNREERRRAFVSDANPSPSYNAAPMAESGAAIGPAAGSLGYGKGAQVLQMLESELGTDTMIKTLHDWVASHPRGTDGEWEEYERVVDKVSGKSYTQFFDEWVRRPGWAKFEVKNVRWANGELSGQVAFEGPIYHLLADVLLEFSDGTREMKQLAISDEGFRLKLDKKPSLVSIDPWRKLLRNIGSDEAPTELRGLLSAFQRFNDPAHKDWLPRVGRGRESLADLPKDLNRVFLVGSPETVPAMKPLCDRVGFKVSGTKLTYDGTTIDLDEGAALAIVDLPGGGQCAIGLGKTKIEPNYGRARLALVNDLGRFLRGFTEPKTSGSLTYRL